MLLLLVVELVVVVVVAVVRAGACARRENKAGSCAASRDASFNDPVLAAPCCTHLLGAIRHMAAMD